MEYIFASDRLYPVDRSLATDPGGGTLVIPDTLICYDVVDVGTGNFMGASTWEFSVRGREGRFRTHYAWALVKDTPENVVCLREMRAAQACAEEARIRARSLALRVKNVARS